MKNHKLLFIFSALFSLVLFTRAGAQVEVIHTIAGTVFGGFSGDGGTSALAQVNNPYQMALDTAGNLYIADQSNNRIRMISTAGIITTVAGTGTAGFTGDLGLATSAELKTPTGVAVDTLGNIYIADEGNNRIRMVTASTGIITTIAGTGTAGFSGDGAAATAAKLSAPRCLTLDDTGNIYFSDGNNNRIREIYASTLIITTVAGGGTAGFAGDGTVATLSSVKLNSPRGVAVDDSGNIYIADMNNSRIRKVTAATGIISSIAGTGTAGFSGDGGASVSAQINGAAGVSLDHNGNLYIADGGNNRIRVIDTTGTINTVAGDGIGGFSGDGGLATAAELRNPIAVTINTLGNFYISDRTNQRVRYVSPNHIPRFTDSSVQNILVCENTVGDSINAILAIIDSDTQQSEIFSTVSGPSNGTLTGPDTITSNGRMVTPVGLAYTPNTGYSGTDSFIMQVTDGFDTSYNTIYVVVAPLANPGMITGPSFVCLGSVIMLADDSIGGAWSASNSNASVDSFGNVTGNNPGTDTIKYTVSNSCSTTAISMAITINSLPAFTLSASPGVICNGGTARLSALSGSDTLLQQNFNTSIAPWTIDSSGSIGVLTGAIWKDVPNGYTNELGTYTSPDNSPFALANSDTSGGASQMVTKLISPSFSTIGFNTLTLTFQQYYENYKDTSASVDISTDSGATWTTLVNYTDTAGLYGSIGTKTAFVTETVSLTAYAGDSNVMLRFNYNSPYGYSWAIDNIVITGSAEATWTSSTADLYTDSSHSISYTAGTYRDTVYAHPAPVATTTVLTYYATETNRTCSSTDSITIKILVPASPIVGAKTICTGQTTLLTDSTAGGTWSATNGMAAVTSTGIVTGITSGSDTIIYTVSTACGSAIDSMIISINSSANAGAITGSRYLCTGTINTYTDTASGGTGYWAVSNGAASTDSFGNVTGIYTGIDTVFYIASNSCGSDTARYTVSVATMFVPSVSIVANPGDTTCTGTAVQYIAISVNGGPSPSYVWAVDGAAMATTDTFTYTPHNGDRISCTLTSDAPCLASPGTASDTITAVVNSITTPSVTITDGRYGDTVCRYTYITYSATVTNAGTSPSYMWYVNSTFYSSGNPFYYTPINGDTIRCMVASSSVCAFPDTVSSNAIIMTVDSTETPLVSVSANPGDTVCAGSSITLTAYGLYAGLTPFYRWTKNGVNVATGPDYTFVPESSDSVYCMLASSSSCHSLDSVFSAVLVITTDSAVVPSVTITPFDGTSIAVNALDTIVAVVTNVSSPTYQWEINGVPVPGATMAYFVAGDTTSETATVTCVVTNSNACHTTGTSNAVVITIGNLSVMQASVRATVIQLFPNPNKGIFSILGTLPPGNKEATIEVADIVGRIIYKETIPLQNGMLKASVTDNQLINGVYIMHIISTDVNEEIRFVISR